MKKAILIALLCSVMASAMSQYNRIDYSPYAAKEADLSYYIEGFSWHGHATQMTYFDMNFVNDRVQDYISQRMNLVEVKRLDNLSQSPMAITVKYGQLMGTDHRTLNVKYFLFVHDEHNLIISKCIITGNLDFASKFFAGYWTQELNIDETKTGRVMWKTLLQDKITFKYDKSTKIATITVVNQEIFNAAEFDKRLKQSRIEQYGK